MNYIKRILYRVLKTLRIETLKYSVNAVIKININGEIIRVPYIYGMRCNKSEVWMLEVLKQVLSTRDGIFLDIGVNLGQTLVKVKSVDKYVPYIGFEPNANCVFYVNELIRVNEFTNCSIVSAAVYNNSCLLELYASTPTAASATIIENFRESQSKWGGGYVVAADYSLIEPILENKKIAVVKIDAEGAESEVLEAIIAKITLDRAIILIEILPVYDERNKIRLKKQRKIEKIISENGYEMYRIIKEKGTIFVGYQKIHEIGIHSDLNKCEYMFLPNEINAQCF